MEEEHKDMIPLWRERGNQGLAILNNHLAKNDFITDYGYSVADIAVFGYTHLAEEGGFDLRQYPHVAAWISRVSATPGFVPIEQLLTGTNVDKAA